MFQQLWAMKKSTVEGHRKVLQIAHNLIVLGWVCWEGTLRATQCYEHVCVLFNDDDVKRYRT